MEFRAGVLVCCAFEENYGFEIEREAVLQFEEGCVMQVFACILKNAERFASFHHQNEIRQVFHTKSRGSSGGMTQLTLALESQAHGLGRPPQNRKRRQRVDPADLDAANQIRVFRVDRRTGDHTGLRIGMALGPGGDEFGSGRTPGRVAKDSEGLRQIPLLGRLVPGDRGRRARWKAKA